MNITKRALWFPLHPINSKTFANWCLVYLAIVPLQIFGFLLMGGAAHGAGDVPNDLTPIIFIAFVIIYIQIQIALLAFLTWLCVLRLRDAHKPAWLAALMLIPTPFFISELGLIVYLLHLPTYVGEEQ